MARTIRIMVKVDGELQARWVPVKLTKLTDGTKKFEILRNSELKGKSKHYGKTHKQYKEWGEQGGRPLKWNSEAERKRWTRQQKSLSEGRELRSYRTKTGIGNDDLSWQEKKLLKKQIEKELTKQLENEEEDEDEE